MFSQLHYAALCCMRRLDLPSALRLAMWGITLVVAMVPSCRWFVRTNHDLVDVASAALITWTPRFYAALLLVWVWCPTEP